MIAIGVARGLLPIRKADDDSVLFGSGKGVVLRYAGLKALDAGGHTLASRLEVRGREIRLIVQDHGAQYPLVVDPLWTEQQELTASGSALFGISVSVSGNTAVIGAYWTTVNSNSHQGAVYVFVRSGGVWSQQQELTASDGAYNDQFGQSVSVSGDTAVIGAGGWNTYQGAAYVFVRSGGVWTQQGELTASDGALDDAFGYSVSVSGDTVAIGANESYSGPGAAYVFVGPSLGTNSLLVGSASGASSVVLSSDGAWTAAALNSFLHISAGSSSGTGNAVVAFTYDAFTGTGTRGGLPDHRRSYGHCDPGGDELSRAGSGDHAGVRGAARSSRSGGGRPRQCLHRGFRQQRNRGVERRDAAIDSTGVHGAFTS
ncbi:MAG: FG-GAP repeat protein [Bryobacteraceae bacterium]